MTDDSLEAEAKEIIDANNVIEGLYARVQDGLGDLIREALHNELAESKAQMSENQRAIMRLQDMIGSLPIPEDSDSKATRAKLIEEMSDEDKFMNQALDALEDSHDDLGIELDVAPHENPDVFDLVKADIFHVDDDVVSVNLEINRDSFDAWYQSVPGKDVVDLKAIIAEQIICARHEFSDNDNGF